MSDLKGMFSGREPAEQAEERKGGEQPSSEPAEPKCVQRRISIEVDEINDVEDAMIEDVATETNGPESPELYLEEYFRDHFTLSTPSTLVRFRSNYTAARVFQQKSTQFILEETIDETSHRRRIYVKQLYDGTNGLLFLRLLYTVMCVFWTGIFFVMCLQILLVMVLEMAIYGGTTEVNRELNTGRCIG